MTNTQYKSVRLCASFQRMHDTRHLWIHLNEELKLFPPWLWMCRHWQYLTEFRFLVSMIMALAMWNLNFKDKGVVSTREPEQWLRGLLLTKPLKEAKHYPLTMNKCNLTLKLTNTHQKLSYTPTTLILPYAQGRKTTRQYFSFLINIVFGICNIFAYKLI